MKRVTMTAVWILLMVGNVLSAETKFPERVEQGIAATFEAFGESSTAKPFMESDLIRFQYGAGAPRVFCAPFMTCSVELQAGEVIKNEYSADPRWVVGKDTIGQGPNAVPVILLKPKDCGLETNLMVVTSRRMYTIWMESKDCGNALRNRERIEIPLTPRIGFHYPEEEWRQKELAEMKAAEEAERDETQRQREGREAMSFCTDFNFEWKAKRGFPFKPTAICRSDEHTVIILPSGSSVVGTLQERQGEGYVVVNHQLEDDFLSSERPIMDGRLLINRPGKRKPAVLEFEWTGGNGGR